MEGRWPGCVLSVLVLTVAASVRSLEYNITTTWNGDAITTHDPVHVTLSASLDQEYLYLDIVAPFFNDPPAPDGPPGKAFFGVWDYEVVVAFFLNDLNQYVEVEVFPWGQHIVLLLSAQQVTVRHSLPMKVTTKRTEKTWTGHAEIPVSYLPELVTKFNAYAIHGSGANRTYESLYPADKNAIAPDFHALKYFKAIDLSGILPNQSTAPMSQLWQDSLEGLFRYQITSTWDSQPLNSIPVELTIQGFEAGVELNVTAPFYNDPAPGGTPGKPFYGLWDYEVVVMFFLNENEEYLEVELGPWGEHLLLLLKGPRNTIKHSLALDYVITERTESEWKGSAMIPPGYFPPNVTRMNAYAIHGVGSTREYQGLYPAPHNDLNYTQPDFHKLELFQPIDFEYQVKENGKYSQVWQDAIDSGATNPVPQSQAEEEVAAALTVLGPVETTEPVTSLPITVQPTTYEVTDPDTTTQEPTTLLPTIIPVPEDEMNALPTSIPDTTPLRRAPQPQRVDLTAPRDHRLEVQPFSPQQGGLRSSPVPEPTLVRKRVHSSQFGRGRVPQRSSQVHTGTKQRTHILSQRRGEGESQNPIRPHQQQVEHSEQSFNQHQELHEEEQVHEQRRPQDQSFKSEQELFQGQHRIQDEPVLPSQKQFQGQHRIQDEPVLPSQIQFQGQHRIQDEPVLPSHKQFQGQQILQDESVQTGQGQFQGQQTPKDESVQPGQEQFQGQERTRDNSVQTGQEQFQGHQAPQDESVHQGKEHFQGQQRTQDESVQPGHGQFQGQQTPQDESVQLGQKQFQDQQRSQDGSFQRGQGHFQNQRRPQEESFQQSQGQFQNQRRLQEESFQQSQGHFQNQRRPQEESFQQSQGHFQNQRRPQDESFQQSQGQLFQNKRRPQEESFQQGQGQFQNQRTPQGESFQRGQGHFQNQRRPQDDSFQRGQGHFQNQRRPQPNSFQQGQGQLQDRGTPQQESFQQSQGQFQDQRRPHDQTLHQNEFHNQHSHQQEPSVSVVDTEVTPVIPVLDVALREAAAAVATLAEDSPALPPAHPICFRPGLVADEDRCWVFHECDLENDVWQVYSWKCMRGHVFDAVNVACVRGRCRRRG